MIRTISFLALAAALATSAPAAAQTAPEAAPEQDVAVTSCAGFFLALASADAGSQPSEKRRAQAQAAQEELFKVMLWVHGYTTGRAGPDAKPQPLDAAWIRTHTERLRQICANDTRATLRMVDAVRQL